MSSRPSRRGDRSRSRSRDRRKYEDDDGKDTSRRSRSRSRDRRQERVRDVSDAAPRKWIQPNHGILGSLLRQHLRTNDRMDKEELSKATELLRAIDPGTHRTAKLLSGHLSDVKSMEAEEVKPRVLSAEEVRLAQLRASAVSGAVRAPTAAVTSQYTYSTACDVPLSSNVRPEPPVRPPEPSLPPVGSRVWREECEEGVCPFNASHRMPALSLKHHITKCPDRPSSP